MWQMLGFDDSDLIADDNICGIPCYAIYNEENCLDTCIWENHQCNSSGGIGVANCSVIEDEINCLNPWCNWEDEQFNNIGSCGYF